MVYSKKLAYLILAIVLLFNLIAMSIYSYLGRYLQYLGAERIIIQIIVTLMPLSTFIFPPILGRLSDKIQNRKAFIIIGAISLSIICLLFIFIQNFIMIIILVLSYGFSSALIGVSFILFQEVVFNDKNYISYYNSMVVLGWFLGAQFSGIFIDIFGISNLFILLLIISLINLGLSLFLKEERALILKGFENYELKPKKIIQENELPFNSSIYYALFFRNFGIRPIMSIITIIMAFHLSTDFEIGFLVGINPLIQFFLMILMGKIISIKNQKEIMIFGYILSGIVILGYIISLDFICFLFFQILVSFSYSMFWSSTHFYIAQNTTPKNKGEYVSLAKSSFYFGSFAGGLFFSGILIFNANYYIAMIPLIFFPLLSALIISLKFKKNEQS